jgi:D-alanyl-D-alanine carboxypeptidase
MDEFVRRRALIGAAPRIRIAGGVGLRGAVQPDRLLVTHRSNRLPMILKRLNTYSNNDIERLETTLGPASELATLLAGRWKVPPAQVQFETLSGLGRHRLTPRLVVRLLRELQSACIGQGITLREILPVAGCDPGTLRNYPRLSEGGWVGNLVAKTGTLRKTDGGVTVLAGLVRTAVSERLFCVVEPQSGSFLERARRRQEDWLLDTIAHEGAMAPAECGEPPAYSDADAMIVVGADAGRTSRPPEPTPRH